VIKEGQRDRFAVARFDDDLARLGRAADLELTAARGIGQTDLFDGGLDAATDRPVVESGGETAFVNVGLAIPPKAGTAVLWNNLRADGTPNFDTMHHGTPVKAGHKAIITKWFRRPR